MQGNRITDPNDAALIDESLRVSIESARAAARVIRESTSHIEKLEWVEKAAMDFVTEVDRGAESVIISTIRARFPGAIIVGEELSPDADISSGRLTFIIDPLDGTTNFLHGFPHYAVSIGVMLRSSLVAAAVLNVPRGDLFTASLGKGTSLNGTNVTVSSIDSTSRALIGTGFPFKNPGLLGTYARQFVEVSRSTAGIRRAGSAALRSCRRRMREVRWILGAGPRSVGRSGGSPAGLGSRGDRHRPHRRACSCKTRWVRGGKPANSSLAARDSAGGNG